MPVDVREELAQWLRDPEHRKAFGAEDYKAELAKLIYEARKAEGLTQTKFGQLLGVSQPYVAKLESGEANPTVGVVGAMFAFFWLRVRSKTERLGPPIEDTAMVGNAAMIGDGESHEAQVLKGLDKQFAEGLRVSTAGNVPMGAVPMFRGGSLGATTAAGAAQ